MGFMELFIGPTPIEKLQEKHDVDGLIQALQAADLRRREAAAKALGELKEVRAMAALGQALLATDRERVRKAMGKWAEASQVDSDMRYLWPAAKVAAARALKELGGPEAVPFLISALEDEAGSVRKEAVAALRGLPDTRAVPGLIKALQDGDAWVQIGAARALEAIGDLAVVGALLAAATNARDSDVRISMILNLQRMVFPEEKEHVMLPEEVVLARAQEIHRTHFPKT